MGKRMGPTRRRVRGCLLLGRDGRGIRADGVHIEHDGSNSVWARLVVGELRQHQPGSAGHPRELPRDVATHDHERRHHQQHLARDDLTTTVEQRYSANARPCSLAPTRGAPSGFGGPSLVVETLRSPSSSPDVVRPVETPIAICRWPICPIRRYPGPYLASARALILTALFPTDRPMISLAAVPRVGGVFDYLENAAAWTAVLACSPNRPRPRRVVRRGIGGQADGQHIQAACS